MSKRKNSVGIIITFLLLSVLIVVFIAGCQPNSPLDSPSESPNPTEENPNSIMLTPKIGNIPAFYTEDEAIIKYVQSIKQKIISETKISSQELDARFSIVGYAKGEIMADGAGGVIPVDNKTISISFVAKVDWIELHDYLDFEFLDDQGNELSLEQIMPQIEVPFYFKIKQLKPRSEIETIVAKAHPKLEFVIPPLEEPYYNDYNKIRINFFNNNIGLDVYGTINEEKNQCIGGTVSLITGDITIGEGLCVIE